MAWLATSPAATPASTVPGSSPPARWTDEPDAPVGELVHRASRLAPVQRGRPGDRTVPPRRGGPVLPARRAGSHPAPPHLRRGLHAQPVREAAGARRSRRRPEDRTARPMTALDAFHMRQVALDGIHSAAWHRFADSYVKSLRGDDAKLRMGSQPIPFNALGAKMAEWPESGQTLTEQCHSMLTMGETFYIAPGMHALVAAAAEEWIADEQVMPDDLPSDTGFLLLPGNGLLTLDIRGAALHTNAITWQRRGDTIRFIWWCHKRHDNPQLKARPGWAEMPDYTPWHVMEQPLYEPIVESLQMGTLLPPEVSEGIRWFTGPNGALSMSIPEGFTPDQLRPSLRTNEVVAWLVSMWRIMQQPIAAISRQGLPANVRRLHAKRPHRLRNTAVTVIEFRRMKGDYAEGTGRTYSHRFLRRGHWRRQPYKRDDGTWDRRRIYIHPTIVGDPDKPLILRNHVNALTR